MINISKEEIGDKMFFIREEDSNQPIAVIKVADLLEKEVRRIASKEAIEILKGYKQQLDLSCSNQLDADKEAFELAIKALEERPQGDIKKYKPLELDYNVQCAVENLKTAYWSIESKKFAKVFTDAEEIIMSAICHHGYSVCKQSQDNITEEDIQNAIKAGYER